MGDPLEALEISMRGMAGPGQPLSGLTVICGNTKSHVLLSVGSAREVRRGPEDFFPADGPLSDRTLYDLASLTKLFTAVAVLRLAEDGKLDLHRGLGELDRRFSALADVPVYEVLSYRAVLRSQARIDEQPDAEAARRQVFTVRREPQDTWRLYSDMNALVLKYLVETRSGLRFFEYLQRQILRPAGMTDTLVRIPRERLKNCMDYNYEHRIIDGRYLLSEDIPAGAPHDPKARALRGDGDDLAGHAGLFSTARDMTRFAQALLQGVFLPVDRVREIGRNRTGRRDAAGVRSQYLGFLCFSKCPDQRLSEVPSWMGERTIALSGYTGNHLAIDPDTGVFDLFLGNRCHNRVSKIFPEAQEQILGLDRLGRGEVIWPDGRKVPSSCRYIYRKDEMLHRPVRQVLASRGWLPDRT